jgi:3-hydroxybutyrate dehydrogenase
MISGLDGRTALVTGSTGGLGLAIGTALAQAGCRIMIHGLAPAPDVAATCETLRQSTGRDVRYTYADISTPDGVAALASAARAAFGHIDVLVNNAIVRHFAPLTSFPMDRWATALAVNVTAPLQLIQTLLPAMQQAGWGRIINMASVYGERGTAGRVDYVTTKAAILGLTRAVAAETAMDRITCNAVCPGSVSTPGTEARVAAIMTGQHVERDEAVRQFLDGKQPTRRFVPAESVAAMVVFLCSPAGADITGAVLPVDGGWLAQ